MKKNNNSLNEHLEKIKHRFGYQINESPRYRQVIEKNEVFDEIPSMTEADEENQELTPEEMQGGNEAPSPEFDDTENTNVFPSDESQPPVGNENPSPAEQEVDDIQNEIIKHNINAMKNIHMELENLNALVSNLNSKVDTLGADVEEVREPTNSEKLMKQSDVSYPYYFNLNDFWSDNWFNQRRDELNEKGVRELPDGSYIADFDDLPNYSDQEIKKSFNDIV